MSAAEPRSHRLSRTSRSVAVAVREATIGPKRPTSEHVALPRELGLAVGALVASDVTGRIVTDLADRTPSPVLYGLPQGVHASLPVVERALAREPTEAAVMISTSAAAASGQAQDRLIEALTAGTERARSVASRALRGATGSGRPLSPETVQRLRRALSSPSVVVRRAAAFALERVGERSADLSESITAARLQDPTDLYSDYGRHLADRQWDVLSQLEEVRREIERAHRLAEERERNRSATVSEVVRVVEAYASSPDAASEREMVRAVDTGGTRLLGPDPLTVPMGVPPRYETTAQLADVSPPA